MPVTRVDPIALSHDELYAEMTRPGVKRVLAEGDSWLSLFLMRDGNLITWLESRHDLVVLDLSYPGDSLAEMASGWQFELFQRLVGSERYGWGFDAIMLNGGGNDVIEAGLERVLRRPERANPGAADWIDDNALEQVLEEIRRCFRRFMAVRSESAINSDCPILACSYDFITPRDCGAQVLGVTVEGPWICPLLTEHGIVAPAMQKAITDYLLVAFRTRVLEPLAAEMANDFHVVDTQGTLTPALPTDLAPAGDWADEIHPSAQGWAKLARRLGSALDALLD